MIPTFLLASLAFSIVVGRFLRGLPTVTLVVVPALWAAWFALSAADWLHARLREHRSQRQGHRVAEGDQFIHVGKGE